MEDFTLAMEPVIDGYLVSAECRLTGQASHHLGTADRERLLNLRERLAARPPREIAEAVEIGRQLFGLLLGGPMAERLGEAARLARGHGLRVLVRLHEGDLLSALPWELLHDGSWPLAMNPTTALARTFAMPRTVCEPRIRGRLRVLLTAATAAATAPLDLATEEARIKASLRKIDRIEIEIQRRLSLAGLHNQLRIAERTGRPFHVWHHAGHGVLGADGSAHLCLEGVERAGAAEVQPLLGDCPNLLMVVFNVCHGAALAASLAQQNLPLAIGFQESILDRAAVLFAHRFYESLLSHPVEVAMARARLSLAYQGHPLLNWTQPRLYSRTTRAVRIVRRP